MASAWRMTGRSEIISLQAFKNSFCKSQFPHKSVNSSFIFISNINNQLKDLCGNWLLQSDFVNTYCEIREWRLHWLVQFGVKC